MIFMTGSSPARSFRRLGQQGHRARPTDRARELPLVPGTAPRDATRGDLAALRDGGAEPADVLVVDQVHSVDAELANLAAAEPPPLDGLRCWRNGLILLLEPTVLQRHLLVTRALAAGL